MLSTALKKAMIGFQSNSLLASVPGGGQPFAYSSGSPVQDIAAHLRTIAVYAFPPEFYSRTLIQISEQLANQHVLCHNRAMSDDVPFWQSKLLHEMTAAEWESLCDGCGKCCLVKLEDEDTGEIHTTDVACQLLDCASCRCTNYEDRHTIVSDCIKLDPDNLQELGWLPETCAYRLIWQGKPLESWHPLISGDPETVHAAGVSVRNKVASEQDVPLEELPYRIRQWD